MSDVDPRIQASEQPAALQRASDEIDWDGLLTHLADIAPLANSPIHGVHHWKCVLRTGERITARIASVDLTVVRLFGLLHDCCRINEGGDPDHGRRAAHKAQQLQGRYYSISEMALKTLTEAIAAHNDGFTSTDPTIGVCWDADRLNLCRLGIKPQRKFLSHLDLIDRDLMDWVEKINQEFPSRSSLLPTAYTVPHDGD